METDRAENTLHLHWGIQLVYACYVVSENPMQCIHTLFR
jgi:hypothetical protein